jgi:hypothetical protein
LGGAGAPPPMLQAGADVGKAPGLPWRQSSQGRNA